MVAVRSEDGTLALVYSPLEDSFTLRLAGLAAPIQALWFDPRTGARRPAGTPPEDAEWTVRTPEPGDWVLVLERGADLPRR
jgi:hypothetical protein